MKMGRKFGRIFFLRMVEIFIHKSFKFGQIYSFWKFGAIIPTKIVKFKNDDMENFTLFFVNFDIHDNFWEDKWSFWKPGNYFN